MTDYDFERKLYEFDSVNFDKPPERFPQFLIPDDKWFEAYNGIYKRSERPFVDIIVKTSASGFERLVIREEVLAAYGEKLRLCIEENIKPVYDNNDFPYYPRDRFLGVVQHYTRCYVSQQK